MDTKHRLFAGIIRTLQCLALIAPVFAASALAAPTVHYFRHLPFNHNSPYLPYVGLDEITAEQAKTTEHYEFVFDDKSRLVEIRNFSSEAWRNHPLTHLGAFRTTFTYEGPKEIRRFFDKSGRRVTNLRKVYEEVYALDPHGAPTSLTFFDLRHRPMASNWGIARYTWERVGDRVIERRYDLKGALAPMAPTFDFHISAFQLAANGRFESHCNLNDRLEVANSPMGIACYSDVTASDGRLLGLTYYDRDGKVVNSPWRFAIVRLTYNAKGEPVEEENVDRNGELVTRTTLAYDGAGKLLAPAK